jgi:hypothetical protein
MALQVMCMLQSMQQIFWAFEAISMVKFCFPRVAPPADQVISMKSCNEVMTQKGQPKVGFGRVKVYHRF